ncbi:MAG: type II secretion system protein [Phycisphaerales bacterium]|nr:MAG: type II secretion system protein [Phycisphaerales bacterium]
MRQSGRAFSMIELLVVISLAAVLIAILLPAFAGSRSTALRIISASQLRQIGLHFGEYVHETGGYPFAGEGVFYPGACEGVRISFGYWGADLHWPSLVLSDQQYDAYNSYLLAPRAIRNPEMCGHPTSYIYSRSFLARPANWRSGEAPDPSLLRGVRDADIAHPSGKALLWDWELPYLPRELVFQGRDLAEKTPILFVDMHVKERAPHEATAPVQSRMRPEPPQRLHDTPGGVAGVDF